MHRPIGRVSIRSSGVARGVLPQALRPRRCEKRTLDEFEERDFTLIEWDRRSVVDSVGFGPVIFFFELGKLD
jgi:hypothetical protein